MCIINKIPAAVTLAIRGERNDLPEIGPARVQGALVPMLAVDQVFRDYAVQVGGLARRLLGNEADAEEATQEIFLQVIRKLHTFRGEAALSTWLYRIAIHTILDYREKRASRERHRLAEPPEDFDQLVHSSVPVQRRGVTPNHLALTRETHEVIEEAIEHLPSTYRNVFVLADVENLSNAEIGELLGLSLPAVKSRLHRARLLLRKALTPYFEDCAV